MSPDHIWFDEVRSFDGYFQREPTVMEAMFQTLSMSPSWIRAVDQEQAERTRLKLKRRREMENCQHGRLLFPIRWANGTREESRR